jgi:starvation-inducible DNA-binding protein
MTPDPITWKEAHVMTLIDAKPRREAPLDTPTVLTSNATRDISGALTVLLADMFALYVKTKNFHWHMSGPHFRDYHLLLDEQGEQIFATTDAIAERVRKIGGTTLRSIGQIARLQRVWDNDADFVAPRDMLAELRDDNKQLAAHLRETHTLCDEYGDVATASSPGGCRARYGPSDRRCFLECGFGLQSVSPSMSPSGSSSTIHFGPAPRRRSSVSHTLGLRCARAGTG